MKQYKIKVTTASGYMLFITRADNESEAVLDVDNRLHLAGWTNLRIEVVND